jgi:hypothetical protein
MQVKGFNSEVEVAIDGPSLVPNTATYTAHVREEVLADAILTTLTTAAATIVWVSSVANPSPQVGFEYKTILRFKFGAATTKNWNQNTVVMDVARTDLALPQYLGFRLTITFDTPVTRLP